MSTKFNFLRTYVEYNSGNECPRNYHLWTALVVLAAAIHKRVYVPQGYFKIYPNLFVTLVGKQGSRKSTAKDIGADIFMTAFPDYPIGAAVQSREDIIRSMTDKDKKILFVDETGSNVEVTPIVFFVNELKNFLSVDPQKMIEFLTDIYDRKMFDSSTIKRGAEKIINPCLNILACEVPSWITEKLKSGIVSGGFARRMIYVYETERGERIPFPLKPSGSSDMEKQLISHLRKISQISGPFKWTEPAINFWTPWYMQLKAPDEETMAGYYESKHVQVLKVAMCLALAEEELELTITKESLEHAISMLDVLEKNMPKLSEAAGRNELAIPMQTTLEHLHKNGGWLQEKVLKRLLLKDLNAIEMSQVFRVLQETEQITIRPIGINGVPKLMVLTWQKWLEVQANNIAAEQKQNEKHNTP